MNKKTYSLTNLGVGRDIDKIELTDDQVKKFKKKFLVQPFKK
jgi:hypothetical protein